MILRNYWRLVAGRESGVSSIGGFIDTNQNTLWTIGRTTYTTTWDLVTNIGAQIGVNTEGSTISYTDWNTAGQLSGMSTSVTSSIISTNSGLQRVFTITGRYTGEYNTITLRRIGLTKNVADEGLGGHTLLLAELDLDEPIRINVQDDFSISLSWNEL